MVWSREEEKIIYFTRWILLMRHIITTMPISIWENPKLSSCVSPYITKLIEKHTNLDWSVLSFNMLWQKVEWLDNDTLFERIKKFHSQLLSLWVSFEDFRNDRENIKSLISILNSLKEKWLIYEKDISIKTCNCWIYESLACAGNFWLKKNTQRNEICPKCGKWLKEKQVKWLMYAIKDDEYNVYPQRYEWHINNYKNNYSEILISRERETWIKYNWYNIDIDFLRSMWLVDLKRKWYIPEIILTNPSWLYNTYIAMNIYKALEWDTITSIVHPYIWVNSNNKDISEQWLKHENYNLDKIIQDKEWNIMQILLGSWLKWWYDYSKINESSKKTISKLLNTLDTSNNHIEYDKYSSDEIEELLKKINWKNVINALSGRIWNKYLSIENQKNILNNFIL